MNEEHYKQKLKEYWDYGTFDSFDGWRDAMLDLIREGYDVGYTRGQFDMKQRKSQDLHALKELVITFKDDFVDEVIERL